MFVFFSSPRIPLLPRLALRANAALLPLLAHRRLTYRLEPNLRFQSNSIAAWIPFKIVGR